MTEHEWMVCTDPTLMLDFVQGKVSDRKLRLFTVACCRRIWHLMSDERSRSAVEVAERYSDKEANRQELEAVQTAVHLYCVECPWGVSREAADAANWTAWASAQEGAELAVAAAARVAGYDSTGESGWDEMRHCAMCQEQSILLREIVGPLPFRPVALNSAGLTSTVSQMARTIYEKRVFDQLPFLADALEEAGCDNGDILNHFRQPGEHVRGCWTLDLILGRE